jgi:hypothetical protein
MKSPIAEQSLNMSFGIRAFKHKTHLETELYNWGVRDSKTGGSRLSINIDMTFTEEQITQEKYLEFVAEGKEELIRKSISELLGRLFEKSAVQTS